MPDRLWLPTDTENAGTGWLDTSDTATITQAASKVSQINSKGSLAIIGSNSTASQQPTYSATARNGKPGLVLDGSDDCLSLSTANLPTGDCTVLAAGYMNSGLSGQWRRLFSFGNGSNDNNEALQIIRRGTNNFISEFTLGSGTSDWAGFDALVVVTKQGTVGKLYVNDVLVATGTFAASLKRVTAWIGRGQQYTDNWPGIAQQFVVHDRLLTDVERRRLFAWASFYTGQNGNNLASDNPNKSAPPMFSISGAVRRRRRQMLIAA